MFLLLPDGSVIELLFFSELDGSDVAYTFLNNSDIYLHRIANVKCYLRNVSKQRHLRVSCKWRGHSFKICLPPSAHGRQSFKICDEDTVEINGMKITFHYL